MLELKHRLHLKSLIPLPPPNRTMLELKLVLTLMNKDIAEAPNRTMLELKHTIIICDTTGNYTSQSHHAGIETRVGVFLCPFCTILPIAPCWNWNKLATSLAPFPGYSQSHHAGIETELQEILIGYARGSQSHHAGIETA